MAINKPGDKTSNTRNTMWDRHVAGTLITGAGTIFNVDCPQSTPGRMSGIAIVTINDTGNAIRAVGFYDFFFDGTNLTLVMHLGSDVTGGGAHLTVAQSNTYVVWSVSGTSIRAAGQAVFGFVGFASVDFYVNDK